ncbi:murein transglycosylase [Acetobacter aceti]|uniref:Murein transglycosylase n=1 Tax=Acetobacter aceti TaxID=435 RepID=A0A1U9KH40_ACEAC|nr:murein transglycosylase [Acetobacter aceti]
MTKTKRRFPRIARNFQAPAILGLLALLSACANQGPQSDMQIPIAQEEARYRAHAKSYYAPPGSSDDPWGPYITEASQRFDVPEIWIRSVIQRESGGRLFHNGELVTSAPGAMGLMQLMPPTYDAMRGQYNLGDDPYDPHDNILAGTGYIRQMYDIYGSPGFLAAYNAGPGRLEDFISRNRTLPRETRNYVSAIGREIAGIYPSNRSQADLLVASHTSGQNAEYAAAALPTGTAANIRNAWAQRSSGNTQPVEVAQAPASSAEDTTPVMQTPSYIRQMAPISSSSTSPQSVSSVWAARMKSGDAAQETSTTQDEPQALATPTSAEPPVVINDSAMPVAHQTRTSSRFVSPVTSTLSTSSARTLDTANSRRVTALAPESPTVASSRAWAIQVGAFSSPSLAQAATSRARTKAGTDLSTARTQIASVRLARGQIYRARLTGLSRSEATAACHRIDIGSANCVVVSPEGI